MAMTVKERTWLAAVTMVSAMAHFALAARIPLGDDEAYYWLWSQSLAWSYPDHPPMIAALVAASTRLFGSSPFGLRAVPILVAAAALPMVYLAGRTLFDRGAALRGTLIFMSMPVFAIGTGFAFPDGPMIFFYALALWTGWRALATGGWWWVVAGAATGLALLSKLTAFSLVLGLAGALAGGNWRRSVRDPGLYAGALVAIALFTPVVVWNVQHDWLLVNITLRRDPWIVPRSIPQALALFSAGQLLYYGFLAPALIGAGLVALRRFREPVWRYLAWMTLPLLVVMAIAAVDGWAKPHWPGPAYLSAGLALGALWPHWWQRRPRLLWAAAGLTMLLNAALIVGAMLPWGTQAIRTSIGRWDLAAAVIDRQLAQLPGPTLVLTDTYQAASQLSYYLRARVPVTSFYGAFIVWQQPAEWVGRSAVYVDEPYIERKPDIARICRNVRALEDVTIGPGRTVTLRSCENLRFP